MTSATVDREVNKAVRSGGSLARVWAWYLSLSEGQRFLLVAVAALGVIFARRPEQLLNAEFYGEDGSVFYVGTYFGSVPDILFRPYAGYDNLLTRLLAFAERAVPVLWAPFVANLGAMILVALLAAFLASARLRRAVPHPGMRLAIALLLVVLPNSAQTLGIAADLMRYVPLFLLALCLAALPSTLTGRTVDLVVIAIISLSGPAGILMLPLFLWRSWRDREPHFIRLTGLLALGSTIQLLTVLVSGRHTADMSAPLDLLRAFSFRTTVQALLGEQVTSALTALSIPLIVGILATLATGAALAWIWRRALPAIAMWPVMWTFVSLTLASAYAQTDGGTTLLTIGLGERYFFHATALVAVVVVAAFVQLRRGWSRALAATLMVLLSIGVGGDLRMFPFPTYNWPSNGACIGGTAPCNVDVFPPPRWTIHWPGNDGTYLQPRPDA